jgi:phospholipid/cholesterol/gamma-HCH transport system substrate-binding protein
MNRRHQQRDPFVIGLVVLVIGGLVTFFGITQTNPFHRGYKVHTTFTSALSNGLHPGSPVRVAGVNVGKVTGVKRGVGRTVDVTMEITDAGRPIHANATMKARPRIFLEGNYFVEIKPGTSTSPELPNGGKIPLSQTAVPVQFDEFVSAFSAPTRQANRDVIDAFAKSLEKGGAEAVREGYTALPGALKGLAINMKATRGTQPGDLARFVAQQAKVSAALDENRGALGGLITRFRLTNDALAARQQELSATIPALRRLLDEAPPALRALDGMLPPLRRLAVALNPSLDVAPGVLDHGVPFATALAKLLRSDNLDELVTRLRPTVQSLRQLERSLPKPLDYAKSVSACSVDNILPVITKEVPDGHLSSGQPAYQDLLHGLSSLTSAQQNFGGDGYGTRYSFGFSQDALVVTQTNVSDLVMLSGTKLAGARPKWTPGRQPPFMPNVPCETQPVVTDLSSATVGAPPSRTVRLKPVKSWSLSKLRSEIGKSADRLEAQLKKVAR